MWSCPLTSMRIAIMAAGALARLIHNCPDSLGRTLLERARRDPAWYATARRIA